MADEILVKQDTAVCWADTTDYNSAGSGIARTHQLDLTGVASTEAREGAKADLGATRPAKYAVLVGIEMDVAPAVGTTIDILWSESFDGTAGVGNSGGAAGADQDYKNGDEAEWVAQLTLIGSLRLTADADTVIQRGCVGIFTPPTRYGMPVVHNLGGQAMEGDAVEMYVALVPIIDEIQN